MRISEFKNVLSANSGKTIDITLSGVGCNKVRTANVDSLKLNESGRIQFDVPRAGHTFTVVSNVKSIVKIAEDKPEQGKIYSLFGGTGEPCIANGNSWAESEVKEDKEETE
jgi:hypothetical protein